MNEYTYRHTSLLADCVPGFFGRNCEGQCGKCKSGEACNTLSGLCPDGCEGHMMPPYCTGNTSLFFLMDTG